MPERIAHQDHIDAGAIQQPSHREIVCRPDGDFLAAFFHCPKIGHSTGFILNRASLAANPTLSHRSSSSGLSESIVLYEYRRLSWMKQTCVHQH